MDQLDDLPVPMVYDDDDDVATLFPVRGTGPDQQSVPSIYSVSDFRMPHRDNHMDAHPMGDQTWGSDNVNADIENRMMMLPPFANNDDDTAPHSNVTLCTAQNVIAKSAPHHNPSLSMASPREFPSLLVNACKVTVIDATKNVFVLDLASPSECNIIRLIADAHVARQHALGQAHDAVYRKLFSYTHMDVPCLEVPGLALLASSIMLRTTCVVGELYGRPNTASCLHPQSVLEPHLLKNGPGLRPHTGCPMHYDGCHFTFNLMLSDLSEYSGGGTYIRCLRSTIKLRQGQVLVHPGSLYHRGVDITHGTRDLLVCFMNGFDPCIDDASTELQDRREFESNIVRL